MNTATKSVEEMIILKDMGDGLLNRIYLTKSSMMSGGKSRHLIDAELLIIRSKIEKKFPTAPEFNKYQGGDVFISKAADIVADFQSIYDLLVDLVDFSVSAKELLKTFTLKIFEFKLKKNRCLIILYLELLVVYMRVMFLLESFEEKSLIAAMYTAASYFVDPTSAITLKYTSEIKKLLDESGNLQRHFIDHFAPSQVFLGPMLLELKDSIQLLNGVDDLRKNFVLNPSEQGDNMGAYAKKSLSSSNHVSAYTELAAAALQYSDFVVFALLACPALLFEELILDLLRAATSHRAIATIHRDITLNVHVELEKVSNNFPSPADTAVVVPKNFKLKSLLKHISRDSVGGAGLNQRKRRAFVGAELAVLNKMIEMTPGLIAPKFPMLLAAAAIAKSELIAYFQHVEPFSVRKDSRANYVPAHYITDDISALLHEVYASAALVRQHRDLVSAYYLEFLTGNDLRTVEHYSVECSRQIGNLSSFFESFSSDLRELKQQSLSASADPVRSLESLRLNWQRTLAIASSQTMHTAMKSSGAAFEKLGERMQAVFDRSQYLDGLDSLLKTHVEPFEIQWFRKSFLASFNSTFKDPNPYTRFAFAYFRVFQSVGLNAHEDCPEESRILGGKAVIVSNTMLSDLGEFVLTLLKFLWDNISALESQCNPVEAAKRLERSLQLKSQSGGGATSQEAYPGCESEVWAKRQIEKFVLIRRHVTLIMSAARNVGSFSVHKREYRPATYLHQQIAKYFASRFHGLFIAQSGERPVTRYSLAVKKLVAGCRSVQFALGFVDVGVESVLRDLFFRELQDVSISAPGLVTPLNMKLANSNSLISKLSGWFVGLGDYISTHNKASAGGIVWIPSQQLFMSNAHKRYAAGNESHWTSGDKRGSLSEGKAAFATLSVELFADRDELKELVAFIGVQGVKAIEHQLFSRVITEIRHIVKFMVDYRANLQSVEQTYCLNVNAALGMSGIDTLFESMKTIGIFLLLREMLVSAVGAVAEAKHPDLFGAVHTAAHSVNYWADFELLAPLSCLGATVGITDSLDLPLSSFVAQMNLKPNEIQALQLFPVAIASLFVCDQWTRSSYMSQAEAFADNEHSIQFAASKLLMCFYSLLAANGGVAAVGDVEDPATTQYILPALNKVAHESNKFKQYFSRYLRISAHTLLTLRANEQEKSLHFPYRAMSLMLAFFARYCPTADIGQVESSFPNALTHASLLDISLGKALFTDTLNPFTQPTAVTE